MKAANLFNIVALFVAAAAAATAAYVWPSDYDELEDILYLQTGYRSRGFVTGVTPCSAGGGLANRQFAAEWTRTAFHDVATADAAVGTGGLDASIWFELDRPENAAAGVTAFNDTFSFFSNLYSPRASAADLLAMSVVVANAACGGSPMPFRAGRLDAAEAGPPGVPEPQMSLETTAAAFARAGFSQSDMITLVACGHTLGGVRSSSARDAPKAVFDSTYDSFDANIATEYLAGNTTNPMVVGANETLNSDKKIFSSDGNETIALLGRSVDGFRTACADVFTRMIDVVPSTVSLTDPIDPVDIKPYVALSLSDSDNSSLTFSGWVRVRTTTETGRDSSDLSVSLVYRDNGGTLGSSVHTVPTTLDVDGGESYGLWGETFVWYAFTTAVNATTGISSFEIHLTTPSTGATTIYSNNNNGTGFPVNDALLYQEASSCVNRTSVNNERTFTVTAAVRSERASDPVTMEWVRISRRTGVIVPSLDLETVTLAATGQQAGGYVYFQAEAQLPTNGWSTSFDLTLGGSDEVKIPFLKTQACART